MAAVEHCAVDEESLIVALHLVGSLRLLAVAFLQHHILQSAGKRSHAFFLGVLGQIFLAFSLGNLSFLGALGVEFLFLLAEVILYYCLRFTVRYLELVARDNVLDRRSETSIFSSDAPICASWRPMPNPKA